MTDLNIWENLNFSASKEKSAYDLLLTQSNPLIAATTGILKMEVEAIDSFLDVDPPKPIAVYMLYVVAPHLGNFRRKVLTVIEGKENGRFPVDIHCHIDDKEDKNVGEENFLDKISEILKRTLVKNSIENLFQQSKEYSKSKSISD
jgi:hypothetical protein